MKDDITSKPLDTSEFLGPLPFWEQHNKIIFYELSAVLLLLYAGGLYFQAATASIGESYQPGIDSVKQFIAPGLWIVFLLLTALIKRSAYLARLGMTVSGGSVFVCIAMFCFVYAKNSLDESYIIEELPRTLSATIHKALFSPNFSNRSYATLFYGGIFACLCYWAASAIYNRAQRRP